jgi:O-acetyl-ADP-ribose deacetylase (regulator of RNase III)
MQKIKGNLLDIDTGIICHGVNCQGVMGSGVAKQIRSKYPKVYETYRRYMAHCHENYTDKDALGVYQLVQVTEQLQVANMFTQVNYGNDGSRYVSYDAIEESFSDLCKNLQYQGHTGTIYFPKIGAGLGGGNWNIIEKILDETIPECYNPTLVEL